MFALAQQLVHDHAARPHIHLFRVALLDGLLGRHVSQRASLDVVVLVIVEVEDGGEAEVNNFDVDAVGGLGDEQDVLRLEVSVDDRELVDVLDASEQTLHHFRALQVS